MRRLASLVQTLVNRPGPRALVGARGEQVIVFWPRRQPDPPGASHTAGALAEMITTEIGRVTGGTVSVAVGTTTERVSELGAAYREARSALDLVQRSGGRNRVVSLEQLGVYRLLLQVERPDDLARFATDLLGPLKKYDASRGSDLTHTMRSYLEHRCSTVDTAAALAVHPNTLTYRLGRVEALTGLDLRQPESMLHAQLALMIQDVLTPT